MSACRIVIVGGGVSGLATAWHLAKRVPEAQVTVLEAGATPGGTARTDGILGYTVDRGPNGFLTNVPDCAELAKGLGIGDELMAASSSASRRFLWVRGELRPLPVSPPAFLRSDLLSIRAKLSVLGEPFRAGLPDGEEETVWQFAARRIGPEFADVFMGPMVTGIIAGDARQASLDALFPRMRAMEREHGSLVRAMLVKRWRARRDERASGGPAGPSGALTTFREGGAGRLCEALASALGAQVRCRARVTGLSRGEGGARWAVAVEGGDPVPSDVVVLATPSFVAAELLRPVSSAAADELEEIPYAGVRVTALGMDPASLAVKPDGFGFLVPREESIRMLGCLWTSSFFPAQAPAGRVLLRVLSGGVHEPAAVERSDEAALADVRAELKVAMGWNGEAEWVRHYAWPRAIPQYRLGHAARVARAERALGEAAPGLLLTGNAYRGVGLNDCARDAIRTAERVASSLAG